MLIFTRMPPVPDRPDLLPRWAAKVRPHATTWGDRELTPTYSPVEIETMKADGVDHA